MRRGFASSIHPELRAAGSGLRSIGSASGPVVKSSGLIHLPAFRARVPTRTASRSHSQLTRGGGALRPSLVDRNYLPSLRHTKSDRRWPSASTVLRPNVLTRRDNHRPSYLLAEVMRLLGRCGLSGACRHRDRCLAPGDRRPSTAVAGSAMDALARAARVGELGVAGMEAGGALRGRITGRPRRHRRRCRRSRTLARCCVCVAVDARAAVSSRDLTILRTCPLALARDGTTHGVVAPICLVPVSGVATLVVVSGRCGTGPVR
jgi:hypothetical protein